MKRTGFISAWRLVAPLAAFCLAGELTADNSSNSLPAPSTNGSSATVEAPPATSTNLPPSVTPPKRATTINGSTLMSTFGSMYGSKFSVSGRTLKLPAPGPCTNAVSPDAWRRSLDYGMILTQGNSDTLRYSLGLDALKEDINNLFRLNAKGTYGESDNQTDTENAVATMRYERRLTDTAYGLGNVEWMTDSIADLDYRVATILSPGIHLFRTDRTLLNVEAGAGYLTERKGGDAQGYIAGRFAVTFERVLNEHVMAWGATEYLPKLFDSAIFYINSELGLATILARNLSLTISYQDRYDNAPSDNKKSNDSILTTALNLNF